MENDTWERHIWIGAPKIILMNGCCGDVKKIVLMLPMEQICKILYLKLFSVRTKYTLPDITSYKLFFHSLIHGTFGCNLKSAVTKLNWD